MYRFKNLTLVGTSHISAKSIQKVREVIEKNRPGVVAIELDLIRLHSLFLKKRSLNLKDIVKIGIRAYIMGVIGAWVERKLGDIVHVRPGDEMRQAVRSAKEVNAKIALIDRDIRTTLKRISKQLTWTERLRFIKEIFTSLFRRQKIPFDIKSVPSKKVILELIEKVKQDYPSIYRVIIDERDRILARNLYKLLQSEQTIVAVIGAGHEDGVIRFLKQYHKVQHP